jgi:nucleoside-diphosphate-sugar epimerase
MSFQNTQINVFGASGFIGSNYCKLYSDDVIIQQRDDNIPLSNNILYFISTTDNYNVFSDIHKDVDTNLTKLLKVLNNCKDRDFTFNFISSWFVYGKQEKMPVRENANCNPTGFYSITKKCAEDLLVSYCKTFNKKYRILRLCNVYGPNDKGTSKKKNALQYLVNEIKNNNPIGLYKNGEFYRDYMHVEDICGAINRIINHAPVNEIFNIGSGEAIKFKNLIDHVVKSTNSKSIITTMEPPEFHKTVQASDIVLDISKLAALGFKPKYNIYDELLK